ncbi:MAG: beta-ketoacyl synthase chain length factor [Acetobacteraceae bacterium]|nr:beta-ketoacyl synthase chain length factor [Acetobacteraceae bacterium]
MAGSELQNGAKEWRAAILGMSVWGPGLEGWDASRPILAGLQDYVARESSPPPPSILSATERRRTGLAVRLALTAAQQASEMAGVSPGKVRAIFGTANGDGPVVHAILESLAGPDRVVSPTLFHNSVHNAAAGYWTIATRSHQPTTSLSCHDDTFAACLLKAALEVAKEPEPVLLVVYDAPLPEPLGSKRPTAAHFAAGLVLAPQHTTGARAELAIQYLAGQPGRISAQPRADPAQVDAPSSHERVNRLADEELERFHVSGNRSGARWLKPDAGSHFASTGSHFAPQNGGPELGSRSSETDRALKPNTVEHDYLGLKSSCSSVAALRSLSKGNPAGRALPLLGLLALGQSGAFTLNFLDAGLAAAVTPSAALSTC